MRRVLTISTRKTAGWLVAITTAATATLAVATPAHAANISVTATCSSSQVVVSNDDFVAVPGDTIVLANSTGNTVTLQNGSGVTFPSTTLSNGVQMNISVTATSGSFDIVNTSCGSAWTLTFGPGGGGSAPPPVIQQFGKPASGTCDAAASATLNWAGVASGGWRDSWAQWMNDGRGGPVCTRMLVYSIGPGRWIIG